MRQLLGRSSCIGFAHQLLNQQLVLFSCTFCSCTVGPRQTVPWLLRARVNPHSPHTPVYPWLPWKFLGWFLLAEMGFFKSKVQP